MGLKPFKLWGLTLSTSSPLTVIKINDLRCIFYYFPTWKIWRRHNTPYWLPFYSTAHSMDDDIRGEIKLAGRSLDTKICTTATKQHSVAQPIEVNSVQYTWLLLSAVALQRRWENLKGRGPIISWNVNPLTLCKQPPWSGFRRFLSHDGDLTTLISSWRRRTRVSWSWEPAEIHFRKWSEREEIFGWRVSVTVRSLEDGHTCDII